MSPGALTIPAAMVLPIAAEIPNHMPRTLRRRPRLLGVRRALKVPLDAEALGVEDRSDGFGNWWSLKDFRNYARELRHNNGRGRKCKLEVRSMRGSVETEESK